MKLALTCLPLLFIAVILIPSCKKDGSDSNPTSKTALLIEKPWVQTKSEIQDPSDGSWDTQSALSYAQFSFYGDGSYEVRNNTKGSSPSTYPVIGKGTWTLSGNELQITGYGAILFDIKGGTITELTKTILSMSATGSYGGEKYRYTFVHP